MHRPAVWLLVLFLAVPGIARAVEPVDLELVLSVDSSGSIDELEFELQRVGYAEALVHPDVLKAIGSGRYKAIALSFVEWSGPGIEAEIVGWTRIASPDDARAVAKRIMAAPRTIFGGGTGIGAAIASGTARLEASPFSAKRRVIDISGDGFNNRGMPPDPARDIAVARGIVINGLTVGDPDGWLTKYFQDLVIGGNGAFVIAAKDFKDFQRAVVRKLFREIFVSEVTTESREHRKTAPLKVGGSPAAESAAPPSGSSSPRL